MSSDDDFARIKTLVLERSMEDAIRKTARNRLPTADPQPGNGTLEIGEVWNDGVDVPAPRMEQLFAEPGVFETTAPVTPGRKDDAGKLRWDLLPKSIVQVVEVITYGAGKYGDNNWRSLESPRSRYGAAMFRHFTAWLWGEKCDPESGKHHLAHAATNALFLMELGK